MWQTSEFFKRGFWPFTANGELVILTRVKQKHPMQKLLWVGDYVPMLTALTNPLSGLS